MSKQKKKGQSVQEFLGIKRFTKYGLLTEKEELIFYSVAPTNISVLSYANIDTKIRHLMMVLSAIPDIEIACSDSSECFDNNKAYLHNRLEDEENPKIQKLLAEDIEFLDHIQIETATARQFMFIARCKGLKEEQIFQKVNKIEKIISEQGFEVRRMNKNEIKRYLALYFCASMNGEQLPDYDGEQYFEQASRLFKKKKVLTPVQIEELQLKDFFDIISPSTIKFFSDHYIFGDSYRCTWAVREYPPTTEEQAILSQLADRTGVTLRIYSRPVESMEQRKIIQNATRRNKLKSGSNDMNETIEAEGNLKDVIELLANMRKNKEPLLHCSVFIELKASSMDALKELQSEIAMECTRSKISVDRLTLRQKEGFKSACIFGANQFDAQFERVLPASSAANLYPFNFSGKTDPQGLYIGRDKYGTNILVDFDKRAEDKTTSNILILGNSGQGKSYLLKLLLTNIRESGKSIICLDPESEYEELCSNLGGCYIDFMSGEFTINPLEPKAWSDSTEDIDITTPEAFKKVTRLSQHIAFLKDFFRSYKDFTDAQIDTIEILLSKLYARFGITDSTDYSTKKPTDFPIMSDFYKLCEEEYMTYDKGRKYLYTEETLQEVCLGINSMCVGAESKYFNGYTNITDSKFLCFGVKGLLDTNKRLKDAMLFNILSFMSNQLLGVGNTAASIDELYLFLTNMTAIEYIRNAMKRVRKKESSIILASQNIEDFLIPSIREFTKPLFSIPTHQFLFNAGQINPKEYMDALQVEPSEFELIKYPERGTCLYRCGNERYLLQVISPDYKSAIFGKAGGR